MYYQIHLSVWLNIGDDDVGISKVGGSNLCKIKLLTKALFKSQKK